jgi:hypothetical protein
MKAVLVDSNVILDVAGGDPQWGDWSANTLARTGDHSVLVINIVIYSEISIGFERIEDVEDLLPLSLFKRENIPYEAAFLAGRCFLDYRRKGGVRTSPLPDFFIGAHAAVAGYQLLTRDTRRYRTYFPGLDLIAP